MKYILEKQKWSDIVCFIASVHVFFLGGKGGGAENVTNFRASGNMLFRLSAHACENFMNNGASI